jgi:hypothetical protein
MALSAPPTTAPAAAFGVLLVLAFCRLPLALRCGLLLTCRRLDRFAGQPDHLCRRLWLWLCLASRLLTPMLPAFAAGALGPAFAALLFGAPAPAALAIPPLAAGRLRFGS